MAIYPGVSIADHNISFHLATVLAKGLVQLPSWPYFSSKSIQAHFAISKQTIIFYSCYCQISFTETIYFAMNKQIIALYQCAKCAKKDSSMQELCNKRS